MSYDAMILDMLAGGVMLTTPEIAKTIGCPLSRAYTRCRKLEQYGFLTSARPGQGLTAPIFWRLVPNGEVVR